MGDVTSEGESKGVQPLPLKAVPDQEPDQPMHSMNILDRYPTVQYP